jgi:gliding motility-associated-like protein
MSVTGLMARDFYWKGGTGKWSDPSMWELKTTKAVEGLVPSLVDNVFIDKADADITIDVDASFDNFYWRTGKISGNAARKLLTYGTIEISHAAQDQFAGTWVLMAQHRGGIYSANKVLGSVEIDATGEIIINKPLQLAGNLSIVQGSINFGAVLVECDTMVLEAKGKQNITFNGTTMRVNKFLYLENTDRRIKFNGFDLETNNNSDSKAMTVTTSIRHYCTGTSPEITITVTNALRLWVHYEVRWFDIHGGGPFIQTYRPAAVNSSFTFTRSFGADDEAYVLWDIYVYNTDSYGGAALEQANDFAIFYKLPNLSLGAHTITNVSTHGGSDGQIVVNAAGGTLDHADVPAPLTYTLNPGGTQNNATFSGLTAGSYNLTVSNADQSTCPDVTQNNIEVTQPASAGMTIDNVVGTNETPCSNSNNGTITFTISGATGTPEYSIDGGTTWQLSNVFNDLTAGTYDCRAKDDNGEETWPGGITINQPADIAISGIPTITHVTTLGGSDGRIQVSATGPTLPLTYTITGGSFNNDGDFQTLIAGDYVVTVSDANSCPTAETGTLTVNQPTPGPLTIDSTYVRPIVCRNENNGIIRIYLSGGTLPYQYRMTSPVIGVWQASNEFSGLSAGSYEFEVKDNTGIPVLTTDKTNIINPTQLVISDVLVQNITTCHDATTGSITIEATGGHTPYVYSINNGTSWSSSDSFTGLGVGEYNIRVRDFYGCEVYWGNENISAPAELVINSVIKTDVTTCYESATGSISVTASGGWGSIRYSIGGPYLPNGGNFANLLGGAYTVSVRDANLCVTTYGVVTINRPAELTYSISKTNVTGCNGDATGSITVTAAGGTGTLQYSKDGGSNWQLSNVFNGLTASTYQIRVRDDNNCTKGEAVQITQPAAVSITNTAFSNITCNNVNNGTITITASGGTVPLTYAINGGYPSNNNGAFTGLAANTYQVTITDANACPSVTSANITIVNPNVISVAGEAYTDITCNNANDGTITITGAGGTAPLTYTITGGASNQTGVFNGLAAGGYQVTISDLNGCPTATSSNITINNPAVIGITGESFTQITCNNANNGTITITASGGTAPLTYTRTGGVSNGTGVFNGLSAGTYSVTVSDAKGCPTAVSSSFTINNPPAIAITNTQSTQITCHNANNGTITVTASGGTGTLTYSINGGYPSNNTGLFTGLSANTYQVSVTDANGCGPVTTANVVINNPAGITITNEAFTHITCNNSNNGTITITAAGGTLPRTYSINGGYPSNQTGAFTGLAAGTYQVSVTDINGCPAVTSTSITINNPAVISVTSQASTNITCNGANNGTITVVGAGGTMPRTYSINGGSPSNQTGLFTGLTAGSYIVTVSDANGCPTATTTAITIVNPAVISIASEAFTQITCNGANNGTITITGAGGTLPRTYSINGGSPPNQTGTFTGLSAGTYQVTVSDANGCPTATSTSITIVNPAGITITNEAFTHITCNNSNNGTITITAAGGTLPRTYSINGGYPSNQTGAFTGLAAGTYQVSVTDINGCPAVTSTSITINNPAVISVTSQASTNITCNGANNGTITVVGAGGTMPRTYSINGGSPSNQTGLFTGLTAGSYIVTVSDANGCPTATTTAITIVNPAVISIASEAFTQITCNGANNGTITITGAGGTLPRTYSINGGSPPNQTGTFTGLSAGTYQVTVSDANGCPTAQSSNITIINPAGISITNEAFTNITCNNANNGIITITATGGTAPLTYTRTGGVSNQTGVFTNLAVGTYQVTVTDLNNCVAAVSSNIAINNPAVISITNESFTHITCNGANNGTITITGAGGTAPLTYTLTGGASNLTGVFNGLSAGTYEVTVSDANGCPTAVSSKITIINPAVISITNEAFTQITCFNANDGTITITGAGGTAPLNYTITGGATNQTGQFTNLAAGTYQVTVSDANGCPTALSSNITIANPAGISITNEAFTHITCHNANNGTITITASGGTAPLFYTRTGGVTNQTGVFTNLAGGTYQVTVTDVNNCVAAVSSNITIINPAVISITNQSFTNITCNGANNGTITIVGAGGTAPLLYTITGGASNGTGVFTNLSAGTYRVTVSDANGCPTAVSNFMTIINPAVISITNQTFTNITCHNANDGIITITATGGTAPLSYTITGGASNQTGLFTNLSAGIYQVTVSDINGCPAALSSNITIVNPAGISITNEVFTPLTCNNSNDGTISITASGGTAPLTYSINGGYPSNQTGAFVGLAGGTYQVSVTDNNGCPAALSSSITINNPAPIAITNQAFTNITCHNANNGTITITASGGNAPLIYTITGGTSNGTGVFNGLAAGTYNVTVSDANSCPTAVSSNITINNPAVISISDEDFTQITCHNANDGTITITGAGGTSPLTYTITGGASNQTGLFTNLAAGTYQVTVSDANSCPTATSSNITIINPAGISITNEAYTPLTCHNSNNGTITITAAGGTAPYTFSVNGGYPSNQTGVFAGLAAGNYQVSVTDVNNCTAVTSSIITILNPAVISITNEAFTNITCNGANNGTITITATGGTAPLTYTITGGTSNLTGVFNGLSAGTYNVTVSDANGCPTAVSTNITIINPAVISIANEAFTTITCNGANDGTITITGAGGTAPLTYTITGGASNQTGLFTNLAAGIYQVTVSDANSCPTAQSSNITIVNPAGISITNEAFTHLTCHNSNNGTITITAAGGTAPYTFSINGGYPSNQTGLFTGLAAGSYQISVTDANNCPAAISSNIVILNPSVISITGQSFTNITCNNANNGTITIIATGGTLPLTYSINGGYPSNNNGLFTGLAAGNYIVTVTDINNCSPVQSTTITIVNPPAITILGTPTAFDITCNGANDGIINVKVTGGTPPYTYSINGGYPSNNFGEFTGLAANTYIVSVTDNNGCGPVTSNPIVIGEPAAITITGENKTDITCNNANDGTITITANGGTGTRRYTRTGGVTNTTGVFQNLAAGTYRVSVTDDNNCGPTVSSQFTIVNPPVIQITGESVVNIPCNGGGNVGQVSVTANGGTGNLVFDIGNGTPQTNNGTFTGLAGGNYQVTITDANACSITSSILTVIEPAPLVVTTTDSLFSCGSLPVIEADQIFLPDGTGVTYTTTIHHTDFAPGATVQSVNDIESIALNLEHSYAGDLTIRLVCPDGKSLMLSNKRGGGKYLGEPVRDPADEDLQPGIGYSYIFTNGAAFTWQTVPLATYTYTDLGGNLHTNKSHIPGGSYRPEGNYSNLVGCPLNGNWRLEITDNFPIDNGYLFKWNLNFAPSTFPEGYCNGSATVGATGGTGSYTYLWSNGNTTNTITDLCADTYTVTVTDENGCSVIHNVVIEDVNIQMEITDTTHVLCAGLPTGSATVAANGGNAPYAYSWNTGVNGPTITDLAAGWYYVTITDANLCQIFDSVEIRTLNDLQVTFSDITHAQCNSANGGLHTGSATATGSNGVGSYGYAWSSGEITQTATNLIIGWNYVTVTDDANCTKVDSVQITEPALLEITNVAITNATCNGDTDGQIVITVVGGTGVPTINWFNSNDIQIGAGATLSFRPAGDYTVRIHDANSCTIADSTITIEQPDVIDFDITITPSACNAPTGGAEVVNITGGNGGETIIWFDNNDIQIGVGATIPNLGLGQYSVRVEDSEGCFLVKNFEVGNNSDITITGFTMLSAIQCNGDCDGEVQVNVTSTAAITSYLWSHGSATNSQTGVCGGQTVSVTVTDANGCSVSDTFIIPQPDELIINNFTITHNQCFGNNDGVATANVSGGILNYSFVWEDSLGNTLPSVIATLDQLAPGKYFVTVTDGNGCTANDSVQIAPTLQITVGVVTTQTGCGIATGTATLTPVNGLSPYIYIWPAPYGTTNQPLMTGLAAGIYVVTVQDNIGCQVTQEVTIIDNSNLVININEINDANCFEACDGSATVSSTGGTGLVTFTWFNAANEIIPGNLTASGLCGGQTYRVRAVDESNCSTEELITIGHPAQIVATADIVSNATCFGSSTGEVNINVSGGNGGPYTYLWADGSTLASRNDLAAGDYTVTVYEGTCSTTVSFSLTQFNPITFTYNKVDSDCAVPNGSLEITGILGGSGSGYVVTWNNVEWANPVVGMSITNLPFGSYSMNITDGAGCTRDTTFTVGNNSDIAITGFTMVDDVSCFNACDGTVQVTATSSVAIVSYAWSTGSATNMQENVCGGSTVSVTVTDANGCSVTDTFIIPQPDELIINNFTITHNQCFGNNDGVATANVSGGTLNYGFVWKDSLGNTLPSVIATLDQLAPGKYFVTVTDANGCTANDSVQIAPTLQITVGIVATLATCGASNAEATLTPSSGFAPYTYNWPQPIGSTDQATVSGLAAGTYMVTVSDAINCQVVVTVIIDNDTDLSISVTEVQAPSCYQNCDAIASVSAIGGQGIISFEWFNAENESIATGNQAIELCGGETYRVVATDEDGCSKTEFITISQPVQLIADFEIVSHATCFGSSTGEVNIIVSNGNGGPYTYAWEDGSTLASRNDLAAGDYIVTVYEGTCSTTVSFTLTQFENITFTYNKVDSDCAVPNGSLEITGILGGSGSGYVVTWNNVEWANPVVGMSITNLPFGSYTMNITDNQGCSRDTTFNVGNNTDLTITGFEMIEDVTCFEASNGVVQVNATSTAGIVSYTWSTGSVTDTAQNVTGGTTVYVTITDADGCQVVGSFAIPQPELIGITITPTHNSCFGASTGGALATVSGGTGTYTYNWENAEGTQVSDSIRAVNLTAGRYYLTVTDQNLCTMNDSIDIQDGIEILVGVSITPATCGQQNGSVTLTPSNGLAPYTYHWPQPIGTTLNPTVGSLGIGIYYVTIEDNAGCEKIARVQMTDVSNVLVTIEEIVDATCYNGQNGQATVSVSGGTGLLSITWRDAQGNIIPGGLTATGLHGGSYYYVTAQDINGCGYVEEVYIGQPAEFILSLSGLQHVSCHGLSDGAVTINATGGNGQPYTFTWPDGSNLASRNDLAAGTYMVTVADAQSCALTIEVIIDQPGRITYELSSVEPQCGQNDGSLSVSNIAGGSGSGYVVTWSHTGWDIDSVGMTITNLEAGLYVMNITDGSGCTVSETIMLQSDSDMIVDISEITHVNCAGDSTGSATIFIIGGTPEYDIQWSNGQSGFSITNLIAGTYTATITDDQNCIRTFSLTINQNPVLETTIVVTDPIVCAEDLVTSFHVVVNGGVGPYHYQWQDSEGIDLGTATGLVDVGAGMYYVTVTDKVGCSATDSIEVIVPQSINVTFSTTETNCDTPTGTVKANVTGGVSPYTYLWTKFGEPTAEINGNGTDSIYNLGVGYYILTLTDAFGCEYSDTAEVQSVNANITISAIATQSITCEDRNDGKASFRILTGNAPFTVIWSTGDTLFNVQIAQLVSNDSLYAGSQIVRIVDVDGCERQQIFNVPNGNRLRITSQVVFPDICGQALDCGYIDVRVGGGFPGYIYQWSDASGNPLTEEQLPQPNTNNPVNLAPGIYYLTVIDNNPNPCQLIAEFEVEESTISYDTIYIRPVTCNGGSDGAIKVVGTGLPEGINPNPYTYQWRNSEGTIISTIDSVFNLVAGTYFLTVTDFRGFMTATGTIVITQPNPIGLQADMTQQTGCITPNGKLMAWFLPTTGAVLPITYTWRNEAWTQDSVYTTNQLTNELAGLGVGTYYITATDANGCSESTQIDMTDNSQLQLTLNAINPTCYGGLGQINANVENAMGTVIYTWSHSATLNGPEARDLVPGIYYLTITDDLQCIRTAQDTITQPDPILFEITDTVKPTCYGDTNGQITLSITGGSNIYRVFVTEQAGTQYTSATNVVTGLRGGVYAIRVVDGMNASCGSPDTLALNLTSQAPHMTATIAIDNHPTCNVNSPDGQLRAVVVAGYHPNIPWETQPGQDAYTYLWSNDSTRHIVTGIGLGAYSVEVRYGTLGCPVSASILMDSARNNVFANASLNPQLIPNHPLTKDSTYCIGDEAGLYSYYQVYGLDGVHVNADAVTWTSNNAINTRPVGESVEYYTIAQRNSGNEKFYVTVSYNGCSDRDSLTVRAFDLPDVRISAFKVGPDSDVFNGTEPLQSIFTQNKALVRVDGRVSDSTRYIWSERLHTFVQGLTQGNSIIGYSPDTTAILVQPIDSTIYTVLAKTKVYPTRNHYCTSVDTALVRVLGEFNPPNAFSPNGDGANDTWKLEGFKQFNSVNVQIYNRWGQLVFESKDPNGEWNGTNKKGKDLPVGTYYYIISYTTDTGAKKISGPVTIIR